TQAVCPGRSAARSGALQTRDRPSLWRSRISGAPLHLVSRCTPSRTRTQVLPPPNFERAPPSPHGTAQTECLALNVATSLHRTILGVRIGVVLEHLLDDLGLELAVGALGDLDQVEVLDRIVVGVELEAPAQRLEIRLHHGGAQHLLV